MLQEFKTFAMRGNVLDMAVGIILGGAFGKIVSSLVNDVLMPPIGLIVGRVDFSGLFVNLSGKPLGSLGEAKAAGAPVVAYGAFFNTIVDFVIVAFAVFLLARQVNRVIAQKPPAAPPPDTRECPFCLSIISRRARRCAHCTSQIEAA